jgi:hypothetical protein
VKEFIDLVTRHILTYIYQILPGFADLADRNSTIGLIKSVADSFSNIDEAKQKLQSMDIGIREIYRELSGGNDVDIYKPPKQLLNFVRNLIEEYNGVFEIIRG